MAKFFRNSIVRVSTFHEDGSAVSGPADVEYNARSLGRGRWLVTDEDGYCRVLRTGALQRFFRPHVYEDGYHSSGSPEVAYEEVQILKA